MRKTLLVHGIVVPDNTTSENAFFSLVESSRRVKNPFEINRFDAVVPDTINRTISENSIHWNYPWNGTEYCERTGVYKHPYKTKNMDAKIACALSHYLLWKMSYETNDAILVLEHDTEFMRCLSLDAIESIMESNHQFIGINDPRGATRKAHVFHAGIQGARGYGQSSVVDCPWVEPDDHQTIQGLAGGSAYIIKPSGAADLLEMVDELGLWHNDCIISHQTLPGMLGVTKEYYTRIQRGIPSTTT